MTASAENKPVALPKSSFIHKNITVTNTAKKSAPPTRYAENLSRYDAEIIRPRPETIRENGGCGTLYGFQCQASLMVWSSRLCRNSPRVMFSVEPTIQRMWRSVAWKYGGSSQVTP